MALSAMVITVISLINYFLLHQLHWPQSLYWINLTTASISLLIVFVVSMGRCLVSTNDFDVIQLNGLDGVPAFQMGRRMSDYLPRESPDLMTASGDQTPNGVIVLPSNLPKRSISLDHFSRLPERKSINFKDFYQTIEEERKASITSVKAYRIKFRIQSVVSIWARD